MKKINPRFIMLLVAVVGLMFVGFGAVNFTRAKSGYLEKGQFSLLMDSYNRDMAAYKSTNGKVPVNDIGYRSELMRKGMLEHNAYRSVCLIIVGALIVASAFLMKAFL